MELKDLVCAKNWESTPYVLDGLLRDRVIQQETWMTCFFMPIDLRRPAPKRRH